MSHNGWRKPTPGLCNAAMLAATGEKISVSKNEAMLAVKRVAPAIGLGASSIMLLDILAAFTRPQDWQKGARPIVWPSNDYLMQQTGMSLSAVKRHLRKLCELGLISYKDSSNGKRWGRRDAEGCIVEAYGFDLAPLAARSAQFEVLYSQMQEERALCSSMKRKITITRRSIRAMIENALKGALSGDWHALLMRMEALVGALPGRKVASEVLIDLYERFAALKQDVEAAFLSATNCHSEQSEEFQKYQNMNPSGFKNEPDIRITNQLQSSKSNIKEEERGQNQVHQTQAHDQADRLEIKSAANICLDAAPKDTLDYGAGAAANEQVDIATIMQSCPGFTDMARGLHDYIRNWHEFAIVAGKIRQMIGISDDAWQKAQLRMGPMVAAAAMALIIDKYSAGKLLRPAVICAE